MTLPDLIARLEAATEGSAGLDAEVLRAAGWRPAKARGFGGYWRRPSDGVLVSPPSPTRQLDAIVALIEAKEWDWYKDRPLYYDTGTVLNGHAPMFYVGESGGEEWSQHPSTILALCIAFVRALAAQEEKP